MITRRLKAQYFEHLEGVKEVGSLMPAWHSEIIIFVRCQATII